MKRLIWIILLVLSIGYISSAQNADDALRYSRLFYSGTARFMSMGGAFTALGGDISTLSQNPAGIGVFRSSELTITPQLGHIKTASLFNSSSTEDYLYNFNLGQAGIVANLIKNEAESGLLTLNIGYSFNRTSDFTQSIEISGVSSNSSLADYWIDEAKNKTKDQLSLVENNALDAYLGWRTYVIDSLSDSNTDYGTVYSNYGDNLPSVYGQNMKRIVTNTGYTGEHAISIGGNYSNKLFFGATIGISTLHYESKYEHSESTDVALPSQFTDFDYTFYVKENGTGFNLKLGVIYKPIEILRIGFAFHSPTIYHMNRYINDNITTNFSWGGHFTVQNDPYRFSYDLTTPFRVLTGVALQVKKIALLSADYEFVDYGAAKFFTVGNDNYDYTNKNQEIKNSLGTSSNIRLGAEVRLSNIYLRGGYGYYGKAWKTGQDNENLAFNSLSFGLGFREQNLFADFGFSTIMNKEKYFLYTSSAGNAISDLNVTRNMFTVTFGYKFGY
jgi:Long-chain fatty acid transport protein